MVGKKELQKETLVHIIVTVTMVDSITITLISVYGILWQEQPDPRHRPWTTLPQISINFLGGRFFKALAVWIPFGWCIWVSSKQFPCRRFAHPQDCWNKQWHFWNKLHIGHHVVTHLRSLQLSNGFICVLPWRGSTYLLEVVDDSTWCCMATCHNGWQCCK